MWKSLRFGRFGRVIQPASVGFLMLLYLLFLLPLACQGFWISPIRAVDVPLVRLSATAGELPQQEPAQARREDPPRHRSCHRYRWEQEDDFFRVEIPMPRWCSDDDLNLTLTEKSFAVTVRSNPAFGAVGGFFAGKVDPSTSNYKVEERSDETVIAMEVQKASSYGTYELWNCLFQGEGVSPTVRFKGVTTRYTFRQTPKEVEVKFPVTADMTAQRCHVALPNAGEGLEVTFDDAPELGVTGGKLAGTVAVEDTTWMLDEEDGSKVLTVSLAKTGTSPEGGAKWWSGVLKGDEQWGA